MKTHNAPIRLLLIALFTSAFTGSLFANDGEQPLINVQNNKVGKHIFQLRASAKHFNTIDSALIILDKYDLTGAGIVRTVVRTDGKGRLRLTNIPVGKYYAGIYTYGLQREYIEVVITVTRKKNCATMINITDSEAYKPGQSIIPPENLRLFSYIHK